MTSRSRRATPSARSWSRATRIASPPPNVVERVLDERSVVGFGPYDSPLRGAPVHRAVPALAPLADLVGFRWRPGRLAATRLPAPAYRLLPRPVLDRSSGDGLQLRAPLRRTRNRSWRVRLVEDRPLAGLAQEQEVARLRLRRALEVFEHEHPAPAPAAGQVGGPGPLRDLGPQLGRLDQRKVGHGAIPRRAATMAPPGLPSSIIRGAWPPETTPRAVPWRP